jgi:hypothetical protein
MANVGVQERGSGDLPRWVVPALAGLVGAVFFIASMGASNVHPTNIDWLMHADFRLHFLGWHLYRASPWSWPIGATPLHIWPVGSSIGLTDSIPIAAFLFKPFDPLLPPIFQFIGLWFTTSYALQGVFGALLMQLATPRPVLQFLGGVLFVLSPPLIFRLPHAALTAHWLVLAALWLSLKEDADVPTRRRATAWALLAAVTAAIQPYILLMIVVLMGAAYLRQAIAHPRRIPTIAVHAALGLAASWVALWQSGSFMVRSDDGLNIGGFGEWSANLLTFIMPTEPLSLLAPGPIPYARATQYEGYAYLGLGMVVLGVVVLGAALVRRSPDGARRLWPHLPLILALSFLAVMAFGQPVGFGPQWVFSYDRNWWGPLKIFRTNGRMIWPLFYAVFVVILFAATRFRYRTAVGLLGGALLIQAVDLSPAPAFIADTGLHGFRSPLNSRMWDIAAPHYQRVILIPSNLCVRDGYVEYSAFALLAGRHHMAINSGMTARYDVPRAVQYCKALEQEMRDGLTTPGSLYVVRRDLLPGLHRPDGPNGPVCTLIDGLGVCVAADSYRLWRDQFDIPRDKLPALGELMEFHGVLDETYRTGLGRPLETRVDAADRRVDSLTRYLADRMEGCTHAEAEGRTLERAASTAEPPRCAVLSIAGELPAADETYAFAQRYVEVRGREPNVSATGTHVDLEGEAVWLQAYISHRLRGVPHSQAIQAVLDAIRGVAR